jgi:hypothetical protein
MDFGKLVGIDEEDNRTGALNAKGALDFSN